MLTLTAEQSAHVANVHPETRAEMAQYLAARTAVVIARQNECGPDVHPFAIAVADSQDFWIDCCATPEEAVALAGKLGLSVLGSI